MFSLNILTVKSSQQSTDKAGLVMVFNLSDGICFLYLQQRINKQVQEIKQINIDFLLIMSDKFTKFFFSENIRLHQIQFTKVQKLIVKYKNQNYNYIRKMLKYISKEVKKKLLQDDKNTLQSIKLKKKDKFHATLDFMKQWSRDLMERQEEIWNNQNIINQKLNQYQNNLKNSHHNKQNKANALQIKSQKPSINIQKIIQEELISKVQEVYTRQMMMFQSQKKLPDYTSNKTIAFSKNSTIKKVQDHQMNLSNYFNNFECLSEESFQKESTQQNYQNQKNLSNKNQANIYERQKYLNLNQQQQIQQNSYSYQTDSHFNQLYLQNQEKHKNDNKETIKMNMNKKKMVILPNPKHLQTFQEDFIQNQQQQMF